MKTLLSIWPTLGAYVGKTYPKQKLNKSSTKSGPGREHHQGKK